MLQFQNLILKQLEKNFQFTSFGNFAILIFLIFFVTKSKTY